MFAVRAAGYAALMASVPILDEVESNAIAPSVATILFAAMAMLGVAMFVTDSSRQFRSLLLAHGIVSLLYLMIGTVTPLVAIVVFLLTALTVGLHEPYPLNVVVNLSFGVVVSGVALIHPTVSLFDAGYVLLVAVSLAIPVSLVTRFREEIIPLQRQVRSLVSNLERLTRANSLTQEYARDIEDESRYAERQRLARDIHDLVGYTFTNAIMMTEAAKVMVRREPERIEELMERIRTTMEEGLADVKQSLRDLRNQDRPEQAIDVAMRKLIGVFSLSTGVDVRVEQGNSSWFALGAYADCVYHFVQEGLINSFRHGGASHVTVFLWEDESDHQVRIDDDGDGSAGPISEGIGLAGMRERAESVGGTLRVNTLPSGFSVTMYLPRGAREWRTSSAS